MLLSGDFRNNLLVVFDGEKILFNDNVSRYRHNKDDEIWLFYEDELPFSYYNCYALARFLQLGEDLGEIMHVAFNILLKRDNVNNVLVEYKDMVRLTYEFVKKYYKDEYRKEMVVEQKSREAGWRGVRVDVDLMERRITVLKRELFDLSNKFVFDVDLHNVAMWARGIGIEPPVSLHNKDLELWSYKYARNLDVVNLANDIIEYNNINDLLGRYDAMKKSMVGDRVRYRMKYFASPTTGRFASSGWNIHSINKDIEDLFLPDDGDDLILHADYEQIDARCILYAIGDVHLLNDLDPYTFYARRYMGYNGNDLKNDDYLLYRVAKVRMLSLSYGAGWRVVMDNLNCTQYEAKNIVEAFRSQDVKIINLWKKYEDMFRRHSGKNLSILLPSGRRLRYFNINVSGNRMDANEYVLSRNASYYGPKVFMNIIASLTRDILVDKLYNLYMSNIKVLYHIHDKVAVSIKRDQVDFVKDILETPVGWAKDLKLSLSYDEKKGGK